jgi:hypothetical protein
MSHSADPFPPDNFFQKLQQKREEENTDREWDQYNRKDGGMKQSGGVGRERDRNGVVVLKVYHAVAPIPT